MQRTTNRRQFKNYLIANKIHFKMMLTNLAYTALIFDVIIIGVLSPFFHDIYRIKDIYSQHYSAMFFIVLLDRLSVALIAVLLISLIYQMFINHRFCGPLVNFCHTFKKITQGDLTRKVFLRQYDFLKSEAVQVNDMIDSLSDHIMALKKDHGRLLSTLEDKFDAQMDQDEYQKVLETLKNQADICNQHLSIFKIDDTLRENQKDPVI
jgi:signal transduction histidine kinase